MAKSKTPTLDAIREFEYRREMIDHDIGVFLQSMGWKHTCSTPGSYWMYEKELRGVKYLVNQETALRFEETLCDEVYDDCHCDC